MVDVAGLVERQLDHVAESKLAVPHRGLAPGPVPSGEVREEHPQRRGLDRVEPRVRTDELERLLVARAVEAELAHTVGDAVVDARDKSAVAQREEVLRREEAERRADARRRRPGRAEGLRRVLEQRHAERRELGQRGRTAEQVHGHDRLRPLGDRRGDSGRVEVERRRVDVRKDRRRADAGDRLGGGVEREGWADHLVPAYDAHRLEREHERVGPVRHADRVRHTEIAGGFALECLDLRPEDEATRVEHRCEPLLELRDVGRVLRLDVDERDHGARVYPARCGKSAYAGSSAGSRRRFRYRRPSHTATTTIAAATR